MGTSRQRPRRPQRALLLALVLGGCREPAPGSAAPTTPAASEPVVSKATTAKKRLPEDWSRLGDDRALTLQALGMPHQQFAGSLGSHRVRAKAQLSTAVGQVKREATVKITVDADAKGGYRARKQVGEQLGQEAIWVGGWLYSRHRFSRFIKRRPRGEESSIRLEQIYGLLPAYVGLLHRWLEVAPGGPTSVSGRKARLIKLSLGKPRPIKASAAPARRWREKVSVKSLTGTAKLDLASGAPLWIKLEATYHFAPPAGPAGASGIPRVGQSGSGLARLSFEQTIDAIGKPTKVAPPPSDLVVEDARRLRIERERQIVTGERPIPRHWPDVAPLAEPDRRRR